MALVLLSLIVVLFWRECGGFSAIPLGGGFRRRSYYVSRLVSSSASSSSQQHTDKEVSSSTIPPVLIVDRMPEPLEDVKNTYYLLRHGQSTANLASIISSDRYTLAYTDRHGLTGVGYEQGAAAAQQLMDLLQQQQTEEERPVVAFVSSPFARARQTAEACQAALTNIVADQQQQQFDIADGITIHDGLMERSFGRLDGEEIRTYAYVWPLDKFNVTHTAFDVESVAAVCTRFRQTILDLEEQFSDQQYTIVLASHADVLQIAQLYAAGVDNVGEFSSYRFQNGEVRKMLVNAPHALPDPSPLLKPDRSTRQG